MKRFDAMFRSLRRERQCGFIAYVTCGDPDPATTFDVVRALEDAGVDAIELGVPFSDPIADGPVIQKASQRALEGGASLSVVLDLAARIRSESAIPLVLFSYLNPVARYGIERFATDAESAGLDAVLLTDLPPEDAGPLRAELRRRSIAMAFLAAPTSTDERLKRIDRASDAFVYYVSTTGVTGARRELDGGLLERLGEVRNIVSRPLVVGFGVSAPEHYAELSSRCDAVVVGSAIVRAVGDGGAAGAAGRAASVVRAIRGAAR